MFYSLTSWPSTSILRMTHVCLPSSFLSWYALVANPQATSAGSIAHSAVSAQDAARVDGGMISLYNLPAAPGSSSQPPVEDIELGKLGSD